MDTDAHREYLADRHKSPIQFHRYVHANIGKRPDFFKRRHEAGISSMVSWESVSAVVTTFALAS